MLYRTRQWSGRTDLSLTALSAVSVYHHLTACLLTRCSPARICALVQGAASWLTRPTPALLLLHQHLVQGAALAALGHPLPACWQPYHH